MKTLITVPCNYRCLVVEDADFRIDWFRQKFLNCNYHVATEPTGALELLQLFKYDVVFLDHDCNGRFFVDKSDPEYLNRSFWAVAKELRQMKFDGKIIIHSANPVGVMRMANLLSRTCKVHVAPFGSFDIKVTE